jgi:hypothetical protein
MFKSIKTLASQKKKSTLLLGGKKNNNVPHFWMPLLQQILNIIVL